ncbi:hypothetical protein LINPERHAP2_LOCUS15194, partial [Linum perenne]
DYVLEVRFDSIKVKVDLMVVLNSERDTKKLGRGKGCLRVK